MELKNPNYILHMQQLRMHQHIKCHLEHLSWSCGWAPKMPFYSHYQATGISFSPISSHLGTLWTFLLNIHSSCIPIIDCKGFQKDKKEQIVHINQLSRQKIVGMASNSQNNGQLGKLGFLNPVRLWLIDIGSYTCVKRKKKIGISCLQLANSR